jgi:hypothetical protein
VAVKVVIAQSTDGYINAYLTGSTYTGGIAGYDVLTQAWTLVGVSRWSNVSNFGSDDRATDLAVFDVGNVYVTGKSFNGTDYDYRTFKLSSATGLPIWTIAYNVPGGGNDAGAAITLFTATPDTTLDEIYVTGRSAGFTESSVKYATIKYTETH